jgi:hypothetical protein
VSRYGQQAPVDPGIEYAQQIADLKADVAELKRLRSLSSTRMLDVTKGTATTATVASTTETTITVTTGDPPSITATLATGRRYRAAFQGRFISTVAGDILLVRVLDGATQRSNALTAMNNTQAVTIQVVDIIDGDGASHTLSVKFARQSGTGTISAVATSASAILFTLEDVGPAV